MKKFIPLAVIFAIFLGGCLYTYQFFYGGDPYYTQIVDDGKKEETTSDNGEPLTRYSYQQTAYSPDGEKITVKMTEYRNKPLRKNSYLKLKVNPRKGIMNWEEVKKTEIPKKALERLEE